MRSGYKVTLGVLTIMILVTITIGTSYSYYSVASTQENPNEITTTCFNVTFSDSNSINLNADGNYAYPMSEANALSKLTPYSFTVTNTCTSENATDPVNYIVTLNTLTDKPSTLALSNLRYKLNRVSPSSLEGTSSLLSNASIYDLGTAKNDVNASGIDTSYNLISGQIAPGESVTYNLYLWIDESAGNEVMGETFNGRILVYNYM